MKSQLEETVDAAMKVGLLRDESMAEDALRRREDYLRLTIDTIPVLAWCNRPDGSNEFLNQRWLDYTGSQSRRRGVGVGKLRYIPMISCNCSKCGRGFWLPVSRAKRKPGCGAPTAYIAGFCSASNRCVMRREASSSGMEQTPTSMTANERRHC